MFEKGTIDSNRKSVQSKTSEKIIEKQSKENNDNNNNEDIDDIFDDLTMPNTTRKRASSILDKVQMFNQTDQKHADKILKSVSAIAADKTYVITINLA